MQFRSNFSANAAVQKYYVTPGLLCTNWNQMTISFPRGGCFHASSEASLNINIFDSEGGVYVVTNLSGPQLGKKARRTMPTKATTTPMKNLTSLATL
eukprot:1890778-Amphidinium_carterae.1